MGIREKLALLVAGLVAATVVGVAVGLTELQRREQTDELRLGHELLLEAVGATAAAYVAQNDMGGLDALVANISGQRMDPDLLELAVISPTGHVLAHSDPTRFNEVLEDAFTRLAIRSEDPVYRREGEVMRQAVPARAGLRWATVTATYSLKRLDQGVARARLAWFFGAALLGLGVSLVLLSGLYRLVVSPVRTLQRVARRIEEGDLEARVPPLGEGELGQLGETLNNMASALRAGRDDLERKVAERTSELRAANERLETLAVTDGLTGVYNHRRFQEALAQEALRSARNARPFSVVMIDVDHFKRFNDTHGHPAGDDLLRRLCVALKGELRASDMLARYGGEEFAVILPDTSREVALQVSERLREAVETKVDAPGGLRVSISLGLATFAEDGETPSALLIAADKALYAAKRSGRNRVVAAPEALERSA
jgi:diguanylate cyclase (GGDEF)-like protein